MRVVEQREQIARFTSDETPCMLYDSDLPKSKKSTIGAVAREALLKL